MFTLSALTGRIATTPSTPDFSNQPRAFSVTTSSSRGTMRYVATPCSPRLVSSRVSASSPATRSDSSWLMMSAATFLPAKLTCATPGARHREVNFGSAPSAAPAVAASAMMVITDRVMECQSWRRMRLLILRRYQPGRTG